MAGIKSINEKKAPLDSEMHVPKIATQAIGEPARPTTTYYTPEKIIGTSIFREQLFVITENGLYILDTDHAFKRLCFQIVEDKENE